MYRLKKAELSELELCYGFIEDGKMYQREQGFTQWTDTYPNMDTAKGDIEKGEGYIFLDGDEPFGYICISLKKEPAYDKLKGSWHADEPYAVLNRLALSSKSRGRGLSQEVFRLVNDHCRKQGISYIRTNTAPENKLMQHLFEKAGMSFCGTVDFRGGEKLCYDLQL